MQTRRVLFSTVLLIVILTLSISLQTTQAFAAQNHYKDPEYGFSFNYPETWMEAPEPTLGQFNVAVCSEPVDDFSATLAVLITRPIGVSSILKSELVQTYSLMFPSDFRILSYAKKKILGEPCIIIEYQFTAEGSNFHGLQYLIDHEGYGYAFTATALQHNYRNYEDAFKSIIASLRF